MAKDKKMNTEYDFPVPYMGDVEKRQVPFQCPAKGVTETSYWRCVNDMFVTTNELVTWKENKPFKVGLEFVNMYSTGQSTKIFAVMKNAATDAQYNMRQDDFKRLLRNTPAIAGIFVGEWRFRKLGRYISVCEA